MYYNQLFLFQSLFKINYFIHDSLLKVLFCFNFHLSIYIPNMCHQLKAQCLQFMKFFGIDNSTIINT